MTGSIPLKTVVIAQNARTLMPKFEEWVAQTAYEIVTTSPEQSNILHLIQSTKPQLLIMTLEPNAQDMFTVIREIVSLRTTAIVIALMKEWDHSLHQKAMDLGVSGYLYKPLDSHQLRAVLESSWHHFQTILMMQDNLELRKLLEKTKGVLMMQRAIPESQAHQTILRMSQDQGVPLKEICQSILQGKIPIEEERHRRP